MRGKKVLVTGGAGFIGSHLCKKLIELGNCVTSLDNYSSGSTDNHHDGINYIKGETAKIHSKIDFVPDLIYHLGEYSRVENSFQQIDKVIESNIIGTATVLEFVRKTNAKLIYAGSSTKFGDDGNNISESPYAWTKSKNTELIINYNKWFGIQFCITYFYNVYGKGEICNGEYATVVGIFKEKMKNKNKLPVTKPGYQERNFTHIKDIISALILIGEKGNGDGYGIGHSKSISIIELAKLFGGEIDYLPEKKGNRLSATLDTRKTESLGWSTTKNIEDYIKDLKLSNWVN